jgi:hypothetical protein
MNRITTSKRLIIKAILFSLLFFIGTGFTRAETKEKIQIGAVENVVLLPWGVTMPARIDTGATTSSLDARNLTIKDKTVEFNLPQQYGGRRISLPIFNSVTYHGGVPDERVIVYRGVPVMAMVRLPTEASDGKANLHQGAIGVGIDIGSGITLAAVDRSRIISKHPDTENSVIGIQLPHWDKLLMMAAEATDMTGLGYLGADFVLDRERGPVLLELNARPGLAIQMANRSGLRLRLDQTDRALPEVFLSPASRVAWGKDHFRKGVSSLASSAGDASTSS